MGQAPARKISDAYLRAPKRSERHLHALGEAPTALADDPPGSLADATTALAEPLARFSDFAPAFTDLPARVVEDLRDEVPAVEIPDWAEPFADARWDDRLGSPDYEERDGRRTVLVTGRPEGKAVPRRHSTPGRSARMRRQAPTRARLAGRPDRVALWAVALGLVMAAMAGFSGNGNGGHSKQAAPEPSPAPLVSR
ncbi:MAG TPA: hypothetical protein VE570_15035 [Thermoleophilaceae bacterium]|nr:hypothetical protein [Thermoleophilaceae bacterium]